MPTDHEPKRPVACCQHYRHTNADTKHESEGEQVCLDCGHSWRVFSAAIAPQEYDQLLIAIANRLDQRQ